MERTRIMDGFMMNIITIAKMNLLKHETFQGIVGRMK
jgi:hypothetical protein